MLFKNYKVKNGNLAFYVGKGLNRQHVQIEVRNYQFSCDPAVLGEVEKALGEIQGIAEEPVVEMEEVFEVEEQPKKSPGRPKTSK